MRYFQQEQSSNFVHAQVYFLSFDFFLLKERQTPLSISKNAKVAKMRPTFSLKSVIKNSDFPFEVDFWALFPSPPPPTSEILIVKICSHHRIVTKMVCGLIRL